MKKVLSLLLISILALSLAACGGADNGEVAPEDITATISVQVEGDWEAYYEAAKQRVLEVYPNATINFIVNGSFDHLEVLDSTDVTNEDVADVFAIPADRIHGLTQNEVLAALDAKAMAGRVGGYSNFDATLGGRFKIGGEYFAFPTNIETLINFVNIQNAAELEIDLTETIEFTELDFEAMLVPAWNAWFGVALTNAAGIEMLGKDSSGNLYSDLTKDFADLNDDMKEVFTALFNYWQAHHEAGTALWDNQGAWGYMDNNFRPEGKTAIRLEGPWSTGGLSGHAGSDNLGIASIYQVTVNGNPLAHWRGGWGLAVNVRIEEDEDKMTLAQAFIEEVVNTDFAIDYFKATGKIMENVNVSVYQNSDLTATDKKVIDAVIKSYEESPERPLFTEWGQVWGTWENALLSWSSVEPKSVEEAYREVKAAFEAMMTN